jgi:hypothetical protein
MGPNVLYLNRSSSIFCIKRYNDESVDSILVLASAIKLLIKMDSQPINKEGKDAAWIIKD